MFDASRETMDLLNQSQIRSKVLLGRKETEERRYRLGSFLKKIDEEKENEVSEKKVEENEFRKIKVEEEGEIKKVDLDKPTEYNVKPWGFDENEGYSFEGKRDSFVQAHNEIKDIISKDVEYIFEDTKFSSEGSKKLAYNGLEFIMNVENEKEKGKAILKFYGPNRKKEMKIVVTKLGLKTSKDGKIECVKILAESIITKLIDDSISGKGWPGLKGRDKEQKQKIVCSLCEKVFSSEQYLKGHNTRMHKEKIFMCRICNTKLNSEDNLKTHNSDVHPFTQVKKRRAESQVKFVHFKCKQCGNECDGEEALKTHNKAHHPESKPEISVISHCEECDMEFKSATLVENILKINSHKTSQCHFKKENASKKNVNCETCDSLFENEYELKKHLRDVHDVLNTSTSPPPKKSRRNVDEEEMVLDIEDQEVFLVKDMEQMEIDLERGNKRKEIKDTENVSQNMDEKVLEKRSKQYTELENFLNFKNQRDLDQAKKEEETKKNVQRKKQLEKDSENKSKKPVTAYKPLPNHLKEIPESCKHFFNIGDVVYKIPGNGNCGPGCGAAHLLKDETLGPSLRRAMNCEVITEREYYKNRGYWCDEETPFEREVRGRKYISFTDPKEMYRFLASPESDYMYSDSEDLLILANMFGMTIKIVRDENPPREDKIEPDEDMKHCRLIPKDVEVPEMNLLFQNGNHFNLVVSQDSDLARSGNKRKENGNKNHFQFIEAYLEECLEKRITESEIEVIEAIPKETYVKVQTKVSEKVTVNKSPKSTTKDKHAKSPEESETKTLKKRLKNLEDYDITMRENHDAMTKEMKSMSEKLEQFKIEVKTLRENKDLLEQKIIQLSQKNMVPVPTVSPESNTISCFQCGFVCASKSHLKSHINNHKELKFKCRVCNEEYLTAADLEAHKEDDHNQQNVNDLKYFKCTDCSFQDPDRKVFVNHRKIHTLRPGLEGPLRNNFNCRNCSESFESMWQIKNHRRDTHREFLPPCRYDLEDNCIFPADQCWFRHGSAQRRNPTQETENTQIISRAFRCNNCNEAFRTLAEVMRHRKISHPEACKSCVKFVSGNCTREIECWFIHRVLTNSNTEQDFQQGSQARGHP